MPRAKFQSRPRYKRVDRPAKRKNREDATKTPITTPFVNLEINLKLYLLTSPTLSFRDGRLSINISYIIGRRVKTPKRITNPATDHVIIANAKLLSRVCIVPPFAEGVLKNLGEGKVHIINY